MQPAIRINNLSKMYHLGSRQWGGGYRTLRETINQTAAASVRRLRQMASWNGAPRKESAFDASRNILWALKDVTLDIQPGEVVGVIGRNGAGKSTLLKVLSRITEPTTGRVELYGRIGSLLEIGTGFHNELTGRENIYLSGAILGMTRREITRRFDEIVAFAEIDQFLDTPVKRYSSGMYVRLAFAVTAHLQPEILIVDEVLAVGDMAFQKKCLGKMSDVARGGRTILLVSHNMAAVQNLCNRVALLVQGRLEFIGDVSQGLATYLTSNKAGGDQQQPLAFYRTPGMLPIIQEVRIHDAEGQCLDFWPVGGEVFLSISYDSPVPLREPHFSITVETLTGERLFLLQTSFQYGSPASLPQRGVAHCHIPMLPLVPDTYALSFGCATPHKELDYLERARHLHVEAADYFGTGRLPPLSHGRFLVPARWNFE